MSLELVVDGGSRITERALTMPEQARAITITDAPSYERACEFLKAIKAFRQEIVDTFDPHIKRAFETHRGLCAEKRDAEAPLAEAERIVKNGLVAWDRVQEQQREGERRRLEEQARREAEDRRLAEAEALVAAGATAMADALLDEPMDVPVVAVAPTTPKVNGIAYRETWKFRIVDPTKIPREYTVVDESKIRRVVTALGPNARIPGIEVYRERSVSSRSK